MGNFTRYERFKHLSVSIFRTSIAFLILFSIFYFWIVPIKGIVLGILDIWAFVFSTLLGLGVIAILIFWMLIAHTRIGAFFTIVGLVYWIAVPCNWIIKEWESMQLDFAITYYVMWIHVFVLGFVVLLGLITLLTETIYLAMNKRSIFWGPWVSKFMDMFQRPDISVHQKRAVRNGILAIVVIIGISIPSFSTYFDVYDPPIQIRPQDYNITYNFWAMPTINSTYDPETIAEYNLAKPYNDSILAELNEHKVNLDLTFSSFGLWAMDDLIEWEEKCPDITYRIVLTPSAGLATLPTLVETTVELIMLYEDNDTLDQWKGLCFDIEGIPFAYNWNFTTIEDAIEMWDGIFDYIDAKSDERGKEIDMECVSVPTLAGDLLFDGDVDLQKEYTEPAYIPDRWDVYAPMIYRAWYEGTKPYGSPMDPEDPWDTSYQVYNLLYALSGSFNQSQLGIYLGITNTSCYGRDLPQPERISWGEPSGLYNLIRDVLIAKHFGIREVTFFLLFDAPENEYVMGGVFSSYGMDFLDVMNETVNTNPPSQFDIYYRQPDDKITGKLRSDWLYDFSQPKGLVNIIMFWVLAIIFVRYVKSPKIIGNRSIKSKESSENRQQLN